MLATRLVDALYTDAMVLADEVRAYFDDDEGSGEGEDGGTRNALTPLERVLFSCESLKITTRLMHVVAWLLTQRGVAAGELTGEGGRAPARRLGPAIVSDAAALAALPARARRFVDASIDLHGRAARLEAGMGTGEDVASPARHLLHRLQRSF